MCVRSQLAKILLVTTNRKGHGLFASTVWGGQCLSPTLYHSPHCLETAAGNFYFWSGCRLTVACLLRIIKTERALLQFAVSPWSDKDFWIYVDRSDASRAVNTLLGRTGRFPRLAVDNAPPTGYNKDRKGRCCSLRLAQSFCVVRFYHTSRSDAAGRLACFWGQCDCHRKGSYHT